MLKKFLVNILLITGSVLLTLVAFEISLRFTDFRYLTRLHGREWPDNYFRKDPILGADHALNYPPAIFRFRGPEHEIFTNHLGCFDFTSQVKKGYILAIGDSTTWGYTALEEKWTTILEQLSGKQVLKCGMSGTGTKHQVIRTHRLIENIGISPDLIIAYRSDNDLNDDTTFPGRTVINGARVKNKILDRQTGKITRLTEEQLSEKYRKVESRNRTLKTVIKQHYVTAALFSYAKKKLRKRSGFYLLDVDANEYPWVERALQAHIDNFRALRQLAEDNGSKLAVFYTSDSTAGLRGKLNAALKKELPYYYPVGDHVEKKAAGRRFFHRFDGHLNALGNRLAAETMYEYLADMKLL